MNLIPAFFQRRVWILSRDWLSELALFLFLPVILYLGIVVSLGGLVAPVLEAESFQVWVVPGIVFEVILVSAYFPLFVDVFQNRKVLSSFDSVSGSPNSSLSIVVAVIVSQLPDVILKGLIAAVIVQLLAGTMFSLLPFLGFLILAAILGFLVLNLALTISLITQRPFSHLFVAFVLLTFLTLSSGWIVPLEVYPLTVRPFFAALPTAMIAEGARALVFRKEIALLTWIIPLGVGLVWTLINASIFAKVSIQ
ncbi:MAG: hypothetical protein ACE5HZ_06470 [Fidelibacterota bacterium]